MKYFLIISIFILNFDILLAQTNDSVRIGKRDSLVTMPADSLARRDTTSKGSSSDIDTVIYANSSDSLFFYINKKKMDLFGNSDLKYKDTELKSAEINVDFQTDNIFAKGIPNDSTPGTFKNTPVLSQGGEVYDGQSMIYNFKTTRGYITSAKTKNEGAYYTGDAIKKINKSTYFIKDGMYTTCDAIPPHYYFYSPEMKVINKKELIAKWIWIYFGGVPFPIPLPFAVFPLESGRRSGIIPPAFGNDATYGYYFSHFGYFWAINDYYDINLTADYYTRGSFGLNSRFRYAQRYDFNGNLEGGYRLFKSEDPNTGAIGRDKEWSISWMHHQTFTPTMRLDANMRFVSGQRYIQKTTFDVNEALQNTIYSNINLNKSWEESGNSMSLSYTRSQDLQSGNTTEYLPNLTFSMPQKYPFRTGTSTLNQKWYEMIGFNYNGQFENQRIKNGGHITVHGGIQHNFSASASPKIGYFNISPSISYQEDWYNKRILESYAGQTVSNTDSIVTKEINQINMVRTFSVGASMSTKFYGIFQPDVFGISAVRQIVTPTVSYSYIPDFSAPFWGYYDYYLNSKGQKIKYDKFQHEIFGGASSGQQQNISFSLGNVFEMKTKADPTDTTSKEQKYRLLNLNASIGYNFAADSMRLSDINLRADTKIGNAFSFNSSALLSPYELGPQGYKINKFLVNEGRGLLDLRAFSFSISTSLSAEKLKSGPKKSQDEQQTQQSESFQNPNNIYQGLYNTKEPDFSIPWNLSLGYNYSYSKSSLLLITSTLSTSLDFNLTRNWKFTITGGYDFQQKQVTAPQIRISRDLHAWIMNFTWNPSGIFSGYYLEIRIKAPQLQDLKITKSGQFYNGK